MTEGRTAMRSRAPWIEASRTRLALIFAAACLLFPLAAALPAAAQEGGKGGASSVERAMYERGLERAREVGDHDKVLSYLDRLAALGGAQPRDADYYRAEAHYAAGRYGAAREALARYVADVGQEGDHYDRALDLLLTMDEGEAEASRLKAAVGSAFRDCAECPEMVVVPAGSFRMGSPMRRVTISEPFAVGKYEVTRGEFAHFVSVTDYDTGSSCWALTKAGLEWEWRERSGQGWRSPGFSQTDGNPVVCVNWDDARAYVAWLSEKTGKRYRLLSESEWEYAARAGTTTLYSWGDELGRNRANCYYLACEDNWEYTAPVGSFGANGFGLHDMHGNVWEWVEDCWNGSYEGAPLDGSAWESGNCHKRVRRGGSWSDYWPDLPSANRDRNDTGSRDFKNGFRVARTLAP